MASPTASAWGFLKNDLQALPLEAGRSYRIGRRPDSELTLQSRSVSGEHGVIEVDAQGRQAVLRDLGSLNGCFVNNVRIKGQREVLSHGDNVRFGFDSRVWTVDCSGGKVSAATPFEMPALVSCLFCGLPFVRSADSCWGAPQRPSLASACVSLRRARLQLAPAAAAAQPPSRLPTGEGATQCA